jgi:hypothetical protein
LTDSSVGLRFAPDLLNVTEIPPGDNELGMLPTSGMIGREAGRTSRIETEHYPVFRAKRASEDRALRRCQAEP